MTLIFNKDLHQIYINHNKTLENVLGNSTCKSQFNMKTQIPIYRL